MLKIVRCYVQFRSGNQADAKLYWRLPFPLGSNGNVESVDVRHGQMPISHKTLLRLVPLKANIVLYSIEIWSIYSRQERRSSTFHLRCQIQHSGWPSIGPTRLRTPTFLPVPRYPAYTSFFSSASSSGRIVNIFWYGELVSGKRARSSSLQERLQKRYKGEGHGHRQL